MIPLHDTITEVEKRAADFALSSDNNAATVIRTTEQQVDVVGPLACSQAQGTTDNMADHHPVANDCSSEDRPSQRNPYHRVCQNVLSQLSHTTCPMLLLLSDDADSGATEIHEQLLVTLAQLSDDPVLAIDAGGGNLSRQLHESGVASSGPLPTTAKDWRAAVTQTNQPGLCLLVLQSEAIPAMQWSLHCDEISSCFGLIVIDGSGLAGQALDPFVSNSTGILFVVQLRATSTKWAKKVRQQVLKCGGSPLGCLLALSAADPGTN